MDRDRNMFFILFHSHLTVGDDDDDIAHGYFAGSGAIQAYGT